MPGSHISKYCALSWERISSIGSADVRRWCLQRIPILNWAPSYSLRDNLFPDFISGLMLTVQQVAQGLAFAIMSSVHPVFGLYSSLFPPLIYAIFGTSHHVSTGTFAITSLISAGAVERLVSSNNDSATNGTLGVLGLSDFEMQRIGVAAAVTFLAGIIQISMFLLHLGGATCILSEPVVSSMTTGAATHVVTSQVKYLLGMEMPYISGPLGMFYIYGYILSNIKMVQTKVLLFSSLCIVILVLVKELNEQFRNKIKMIIPVDLVLIITTSLACYFADMENVYGVKVVGPLPKGIPSPQVPPLGILSDVVTEAFSVALVGYTVSIFLAYNSAKKFKYTVDENQELLAHGLSNIIPSFLLCIPNAAAPARTFLLYNNGAKTQVACLISCTMVLLVIYFIVPLLYWLPLCVLASITVVALKGMLIQFRDLKKYWNVDKMDWVIWIFTYLVTICFAANIGLLFGVVFNISLVIFRLTRGKTLHFIQVDNNCIRMSVNVQSESYLNAKVISMRKPLFFLNAQKFHDEMMKINEYVYEQKASLLLNSWTDEDCNGKASVSQLQSNERSSLILDCSGITFFDFTGAAALAQICLELDRYDTDVLLASCNVSLVKALKYRGFGIEHLLLFDSVQSALHALQIKENGTSLEGTDSSDV
ncbi:anion exchange transporter [Spea bombifrons]|uniref:anion exchange transporter n=1 Tax=Spea bombifrons TaxID=233779 RepID=UPI00234BCED3|nr:anion exchange transporter [Spea bombifrons]